MSAPAVEINNPKSLLKIVANDKIKPYNISLRLLPIDSSVYKINFIKYR